MAVMNSLAEQSGIAKRAIRSTKVVCRRVGTIHLQMPLRRRRNTIRTLIWSIWGMAPWATLRRKSWRSVDATERRSLGLSCRAEGTTSSSQPAEIHQLLRANSPSTANHWDCKVAFSQTVTAHWTTRAVFTEGCTGSAGSASRVQGRSRDCYHLARNIVQKHFPIVTWLMKKIKKPSTRKTLTLFGEKNDS